MEMKNFSKAIMLLKDQLKSYLRTVKYDNRYDTISIETSWGFHLQSAGLFAGDDYKRAVEIIVEEEEANNSTREERS